MTAAIEAWGTLLLGVGSLGGLAAFVPFVRRQKATASKVDDLHAAKFPGGES